MKLSKESQCGLTGVLTLVMLPPGTTKSVAEIAEETQLARPFLAKVFQRLARGGVLRAQRGRSQGYLLAKPASEISVRSVLEAIEGPNLFTHCVFWSNSCSEQHPCVLHAVWREVASRAPALLEATSIAELAERNAAAGVRLQHFGDLVPPRDRAALG